ncbi:MAG: hypothetical protein N2C14_23875 [Planctomycetales bacterium]
MMTTKTITIVRKVRAAVNAQIALIEACLELERELGQRSVDRTLPLVEVFALARDAFEISPEDILGELRAARLLSDK